MHNNDTITVLTAILYTTDPRSEWGSSLTLITEERRHVGGDEWDVIDCGYADQLAPGGLLAEDVPDPDAADDILNRCGLRRTEPWRRGYVDAPGVMATVEQL